MSRVTYHMSSLHPSLHPPHQLPLLLGVLPVTPKCTSDVLTFVQSLSALLLAHRECSLAATGCLSTSMHEVIKAASGGAHIPPSVMHSAQDAIAAIYYLLQLHGSFIAESGAEGHAAICSAAEAMITSLKVNLPVGIDNLCTDVQRTCR